MRGRRDPQSALFVVVDMEEMIPEDHPLRKIKRRVDEELREMSRLFTEAYAEEGRPSVPPERLIKASMLQALYSIRSERLLCEQIGYNILFRWFLDMTLDERVWHHSTFTRSRERFAEHGLMRRFFDRSVARAIAEEAASVDHFSVDGTLIEAWASMKSFRPQGEDDDPEGGGSNRWVDFKGEKRSNQTHASKTDPEARLAKKAEGQASMMAHSVHVLMENRSGLVLDIRVAEANGTAEREEAKTMLRRVRRRHRLRPKTLGADKGYDDGPFLHEIEHDFKITPHVAVREGPIRATDDAGEARRRARRRSRNVGYQISQCVRKRIEPCVGWLKQIAEMSKTRFVGRWKTQIYGYAASATFNFLRLANLESG